MLARCLQRERSHGEQEHGECVPGCTSRWGRSRVVHELRGSGESSLHSSELGRACHIGSQVPQLFDKLLSLATQEVTHLLHSSEGRVISKAAARQGGSRAGERGGGAGQMAPRPRGLKGRGV